VDRYTPTPGAVSGSASIDDHRHTRLFQLRGDTRRDQPNTRKTVPHTVSLTTDTSLTVDDDPNAIDPPHTRAGAGRQTREPPANRGPPADVSYNEATLTRW
jgi:hypothetical protein